MATDEYLKYSLTGVIRTRSGELNNDAHVDLPGSKEGQGSQHSPIDSGNSVGPSAIPKEYPSKCWYYVDLNSANWDLLGQTCQPNWDVHWLCPLDPIQHSELISGISSVVSGH